MKGVNGSHQDYGMRMYDPRVGRFFSVDPLAFKYPFYTPYQFAGNMPIKFIDLDGCEPAMAPSEENKGQTIQAVHKGSGKMSSWFSTGTAWNYIPNPDAVVTDELYSTGTYYIPEPVPTFVPQNAELLSTIKDIQSNISTFLDMYRTAAQVQDGYRKLTGKEPEGIDFMAFMDFIGTLKKFEQEGKMADLPIPELFVEYGLVGEAAKISPLILVFMATMEYTLNDMYEEDQKTFSDVERKLVARSASYEEFAERVTDYNNARTSQDPTSIVMVYTNNPMTPGTLFPCQQPVLWMTNYARPKERLQDGSAYNGFTPNFVIWGYRSSYTGCSFQVEGCIPINPEE